MITVTRTYTRPSIEVPWHLDQPFESLIYTPEFKEHVHSTYGSQIVYQENTVSEDSLTLSYQIIWDTVEHYQAYLADPVCAVAWAARDAHNTEYGITGTPSVVSDL